MRLVDLRPKFITYDERGGGIFHHDVLTIGEAQGVDFMCPKCVNGHGHHVICWSPAVPDHAQPGPGRWRLEGTGLEDLSLVGAAQSSVQLMAGCMAHFHVTNGEVTGA